MSELSQIYRATINRAYYIASFLMRDENLTIDVLKESYSQVGQYTDMLQEGTQVQALVDRVVSAQSLEDLRLKDNVSYQAFYTAEDEDHSFYIDRDKLAPFEPKPQSSANSSGASSYDRAAGRFVTTLRLQPQPQSDAAFLYYYVGMSVAEIAAAMDVSEDVVEGHLHASNVKLMADAEDWMRQGRIPAGIDTIPFLIWSLKRDAQRNPYRGADLFKASRESRESAQKTPQGEASRRTSDARRRAEAELADDTRLTGGRDASPEDDRRAQSAANPASDGSAGLFPAGGRHTRKTDAADDRYEDHEDYEEDEAAARREGSILHKIPVLPVLIGILIAVVIIIIAVAAHGRSRTAADSTQTSISTSSTADSSASSTSSSSASSSDSTASSSSSSEDNQTVYDDPMDDPDGYIFPNISTQDLTDADVEGMDAEHLRLGRNEIYARYGVIFGDQTLQNYFESKNWYHGTVQLAQFNSSVFNQYENRNLKFILRKESELNQ